MFKIEDFDIKLDTDFIGRNFLYSQQVESTNSFLLKNSDYSEDGTILLSEYQSNGRGRRKRTWQSAAEENLTFSILFTYKLTPEFLNLLNLSASVAVSMALENLHQLAINLKWPNDVLANNSKIAGILTESVSKGNKIERAVIGIGINVNQTVFPGKYIIPPTSARLELKKPVNRERLLSETLNNFEMVYKVLRKNPDKILDEWRQRCKMIGEKVTVSDDNSSKYGIFLDIASNGNLILKRGNETESINFGDVSLR